LKRPEREGEEGEWKKDKKRGEEREESVCRMSVWEILEEREASVWLSLF
jgi:hypothetical protein